MEENKNNALEKAENIAENNEKPKKTKKSTKKSAKKQVKQAKVDKKQQSKKLKQDRKIEKERIRAQKEKALAQKRVELARIKAHKKAEKQKAKATRLREKNRRRAELKEKRELLRAQRKERKEMLKNESKKDRQKRIAMEKRAKREKKQALLNAKLEKRKQMHQQKMQKREAKRAEKEQKRKDKQRKRDSRRGYGGWLAAVISLGLATLVLASVLTFTFLMPSANDMSLEMGYQRAFLDTVEQVENMDLNLSKALASKDTGAIQKYLVNTAINSELAEKDIQELPLSDEYKFYTAKVINQIADFSKYIVNKLIDGEKLTNSDIDGLKALYSANLELKKALNQMMSDMGEDYSFSSLEQNQKGDALLSGLSTLENLSVTYPELIYDGPFSDGQSKMQMKGLEKSEITENQATEIFAKIFKGYSFEKVECVGETNSQVECFNIEGTNQNDEVLYAQITKNGGKLIMFSLVGDCQEVKIDSDKAIFNGLEFLQSLGLDDMQEVWFNLSNGVYTINYVYKTDGVIIYPDMIKVRVCAETGKVIGLEAKTYYSNHTERTIKSASLSKEQAESKVFDELNIESCRLALVPYNQNGERLCYEFSGNYNGDTFYVYIDANSGTQVQMFKVVNGSEGTLLM